MSENLKNIWSIRIDKLVQGRFMVIDERIDWLDFVFTTIIKTTVMAGKSKKKVTEMQVRGVCDIHYHSTD